MADPVPGGALAPLPLETAPSAGKYEILGCLATGGMAHLFIARRSGIEGFRKMVALKRIRPERASDPNFIEMFLEEARLAAQLDHPNVVHVHDIGQAGEEFFFTMEYIHGHTVLSLMQAGDERELADGPACQIAAGAAAGLHHAHERVGFEGEPLGIVHRDVSPTNVLVSYDGVVKLVDFGVAKAAPSSHETTTGTLKGKAPYMSPEQCRSRDMDRRTDVWALGVMLYEMTTGRRPFVGDSNFELMKQIVESPLTDPSSIRAGYPPPVAAIVSRALHKDPDERYPTARAMQRELQAFIREHHPEFTSVDALAQYVVDRCGSKPYPWQDVREPISLLEVTRAEVLTANMPATVAAPQAQIGHLARPRSVRPLIIAGIAGAGVALGLATWLTRSEDSLPAPVAEPEAALSTTKTEPKPERAAGPTEPERQAAPTEPERQAGPTEPERPAGATEPGRQAGPTEPESAPVKPEATPPGPPPATKPRSADTTRKRRKRKSHEPSSDAATTKPDKPPLFEF